MARSTQLGSRQAKDQRPSSQRFPSRTEQARSPGNDDLTERDEVYGVISVLYHALQGAETYGKYVRDAQNAGDTALEKFFESCRSEEEQRAARAKSLLAERLGGTGDAANTTEFDDENEDEDEDEDE